MIIGYIGLGLLLIAQIIFFSVQYSTIRRLKKNISEGIDRELNEKKKSALNEYNVYCTELAENYQKQKSSTEEAIDFQRKQQEIYLKDNKDNLDVQIKLEKELRYKELEREYDKEKERLKKALIGYTQDLEYEQNLFKESKQKEREAIDEEIAGITELLNDFRRKREVINQEVLRLKQIQDETDFYKICINDNDKADLEAIREVEHLFHNKELLHRAAYDTYIKKPLSELIKRVVGSAQGGIYCITYVPTGEIYIGRTTDFSKRWQEHVKSAFGVGTIAHQSIHTKMAKDGIWNFTFQILEEVPKDKQAEREKFYIELYGSKSMLNEKAGG